MQFQSKPFVEFFNEDEVGPGVFDELANLFTISIVGVEIHRDRAKGRRPGGRRIDAFKQVGGHFDAIGECEGDRK